jgi:predicted phage terminase large subunit-like protein
MGKILTEQAPYPHKFYSSDKLCVVNNIEILFRSGDQPDTLRGLSLDGFGIDEAREFKDRSIYDIMIGRLSNSKNAQGFITTSPKGKNWCFELESQPEIETIIQRTSENPFLPKEYITSLKSSYTTNFQRQELDADIVEFGAGIINAEWFKLIEYMKPDISKNRAVRFWDLAVSIKTSADFSAGALCSFQNDRFVIHDIVHGKMEYPDLRKKIIETAQRDGSDTVICVEEAGQQRGFIDDLKRLDELRPYTIMAQKPEGDKLNRAMPWASRAQLGNVLVCRGMWNKDFFDECNDFTADDSHVHDDQIDAVSGAYQMLCSGAFVLPGAFSV